MVLIATTFSLGAIITLASYSDLRWLVIPILLFIGVGIVALIAVVLRLAQKDPTPLVLGELSGEDWLAHKQLLMGDSDIGDRIEPPPVKRGEPIVLKDEAPAPSGDESDLALPAGEPESK